MIGLVPVVIARLVGACLLGRPSARELTAAHAPVPGTPLVKDFPQAQLPGVTRCAPELKRVELLRNHVGGHLKVRVSCHQQQVHAILVPVVEVPSFVGSHIRRQHDTSAIPQTEPGELEPAKMGCAALANIDAARHLRQRGEKI